jgi:uncharacterized protein YutE (UPF0331/DUF86 family)
VVDRDVVLAKMAAIDYCLRRIAEVRGPRSAILLPLEAEEIVELNLQRTIQAAIDLAVHIVSTEGYGLPDSVAATFALLEQQAVIDAQLAGHLRRMVGFRNIAVHEYQTLDPAIVARIVEERLDDLRAFTGRVAERFGPDLGMIGPTTHNS